MAERRWGGFDSLPQALAYAAEFPDLGLAYFDARGELEQRLSYEQLYAKTCGFATLLTQMLPGTPHDTVRHVGLLGATGPDFLASFVACQMLGWVPCVLPVPAALQDMGRYVQTVEHMCRAAGVSVLLGPQKILAAMDSILQTQGTVRAANCAYEALAEKASGQTSHSSQACFRGRDAGIAYVQFSSGSTGKPKGMAISHAALMAQADCVLRHGLRVTQADRAFSWLPYYHDMGLVGMVLTPLCGQVPVDYLAPSSFVRRPGLWLSLMSKQQSTITYAPGFAFAHASGPMAKLDEQISLERLRIAGVGGDQLRHRELAVFVDRYASMGFDANAFKPSYGLAEATLAVSMSDAVFAELEQRFHIDDDGKVRSASGNQSGGDEKCPTTRSLMTCGRPLSGWNLQICGVRGEILPPLQVGQVMVQGVSQMSAMLEDGVPRVLDTANALATGDLGFVTPAGELFITGREKDVLIVRGRNIAPAEVEDALADCLAVDAGDLLLMQRGAEAGSTLLLLVHAKVFAHVSREAVEKAVARVLGSQVDVRSVSNGMIERTSSGKKARARTRESFLAHADASASADELV